MYIHLTKLILAGVVAVILTVEPANAFHKGVVHGRGGEAIQTLDSLVCAPGQIAKWTGIVWLCAADVDTDTNTNAATICAADLLLDGDGDCVAVPSVGDVTGLESQIAAVQRIVEPKLVFVTAGIFLGAFGGLAGADATCQAVAVAAGLGGDFMAWLSDADSTPTIRFTTLPLGPYHMLDGRIVATNFSDLLDGTINANINITELGDVLFGDIFGISVWTGTKADGTSNPPFCEGRAGAWTSSQAGKFGSVGSTLQSIGSWTEAGFLFCGFGQHLYCFEQ